MKYILIFIMILILGLAADTGIDKEDSALQEYIVCEGPECWGVSD